MGNVLTAAESVREGRSMNVDAPATCTRNTAQRRSASATTAGTSIRLPSYQAALFVLSGTTSEADCWDQIFKNYWAMCEEMKESHEESNRVFARVIPFRPSCGSRNYFVGAKRNP